MTDSLRRLLAHQDLDGFWNTFFDWTESPGFHAFGRPWQDDRGMAALSAAIAAALGREGPVALVSATYIEEGDFVHGMAVLDSRMMATAYFPSLGLGCLAVLRAGGGADYFEFFVGTRHLQRATAS